MEDAWGRIILAPESTSARFHDKVLVLNNGQTVNVSRSSSEEKPDTENAVFDCRVRFENPLGHFDEEMFRFCQNLRQS